MTQKTENVKTPSSRRKFIKKASVGALITTLPAQSVWGACTVSGALSGGSKEVGECVGIDLYGGRSPGFWRDGANGERIADGFPYLKVYKPSGNKDSDAYKLAEERYECEKAHLGSIIEQAKSHTINIGTDPVVGGNISLNIADALDSPGGIAWNLAAVYLNVVFGFYSVSVRLPSGDLIDTPDELIRHLYALDARGELPSNDSTYGFTDGSTSYRPSPSSCSI